MNGPVDLTNCDREPIHIPGSVQAHGVLLVIREADMRIVQVSENVQAIAGKTSSELLGKPLSVFVSQEDVNYWQHKVLSKRLEGNPLYLAPMTINGRLFEGSIHRHDGALLLQLEPRLDEPQSRDVYLSARSVLMELQQARSLDEFSDLAARGIREQTGLDRVVVYRFLADDTGEVIGESKREDLTSWMGLRYPASDIPKQARALYLKSWLRIISDVNSTPVPMTPAMNPMTGAPLDMTYSVLRSVSPVHIQYLKNMGVQTSMSLSLIHREKLWGLIACHHDTPKQISQEARIACEFLAHSASLQIGAKEEQERRGYVTKLGDDIRRLTKFMTAESPLEDCLLKQRPDVMSLFRASGAAVITSTGIHLRGVTPNGEEVKSLFNWLLRQPFDEGVFATDRLAELYPEATDYQASASGLLAIRVEEVEVQWLLWFRQEMVQVLNWAGDPHKPVETDPATGVMKLSPRRSFALWREESHGLSEPWWAEELTSAAELRRAVVEVVLRRVQELKRANEDLSQSNEELDAFAYAASHDLKQPLRGIQLYSGMLLNSLDEKSNQEEYRKLDMVLKLAARMDDLIDSLLEFSRVGQLALETEQIDMQQLVEELVSMMAPQLEKQGVTVRLPKPLTAAQGDKVRVREVFQNLITNAAKYNEKAERWVEVGNADDQPSTFYIRDNGIGIEKRHHESIFRLFRRLHPADMYGGGSGAGLTIARKIVERHGGKLWLESGPGEGTTFYFTLGSAR